MSSDNSDSEVVTTDHQATTTATKRPCSQEQLDHLAIIRLKAVEARKQRAIERKRAFVSSQIHQQETERKKVSSYKMPMDETSDSSSESDEDAKPKRSSSSLKRKVEYLEKQLLKLHYKTKYGAKLANQAAAAAPASTPQQPPVVVNTSSPQPARNQELQDALAQTLQKSMQGRQVNFPSPLSRIF